MTTQNLNPGPGHDPGTGIGLQTCGWGTASYR